jgi:hypothetical protein
MESSKWFKYQLQSALDDMPLLRNAQKVLDRARAAGKIE